MSNSKVDIQDVIEQLRAGSDMSPELVEIFSEEAEDHMRTIYDGLDRMRVDVNDMAALGDIRRAAHTLKGAAGAVGMESVTRLSHRMEDLLDHLFDTKQSATEQQVHLLLSTADQLQDLTTTEFDFEATAANILEIYQGYEAEMGTCISSDGDSSETADTAETTTTVASGDTPSAADDQTAGEDDAAIAAALAAMGGSMDDLAELAEFSTESDNSTVAQQAEVANKPATLETDAEPAVPVEDASQSQTKPQTTAAVGSNSTKGTKPTKEATQYLRVPLTRLDSLVALVGEMVVNRSAFHQRLADLEHRIEDMQTALSRFRNVAHDVETRYSVEALKSGTSNTRGVSPNLAGRLPAAAGLKPAGELDSLEFDRYTEFHLLARTLSEATNDVAVITSEFRNLHGDFDSLLGRQQRLNRDAQDGLMRIRMVPVSNMVNRIDRTVRSVSNRLGKKVDLQILGENTELDKTVLEEVTDPLLHLVRNALDHGIESTEDRLKAGKPERAQLTIEALNQGTQVTIRVTDDGGGLNVRKIRQKAMERGIITENQELSAEETHGLIFLPGFSTAASLTDVSGRGVGMDVVRDAVQRLKGSISVESQAGEGSTFTIHLPTTLAVSRALLIESNGHPFAIPMQAVQQILRLDPESVSLIGAQPIVNLGDRTVQIQDMASHLQLRSQDESAFNETKPLLLIRTGDDEVAITVDHVVGGQDIVVKTLGDHLADVPGLIGGTVAGDGTVIPILDPADLVGQKQAAATATPFAGVAEISVSDRRKTAMVIDDSISVRRVTTNLLRSAGWDVIVAKDGVDALEQLAAAETPPEVFLCDMEMPRMDGIELVGRLRNQPEFSSTPIVMVTSRAGEKHRKLAADAGATEHVVKPFNDDQLIGLITQLVNTARETINA